MTRKNLIVGTILHYDFDRVEPFFSSLSSTKYSGDLVLFYSDVPLWTIKLLRRKGAILIPFERSFPHLEPSLAKHASRWATPNAFTFLACTVFGIYLHIVISMSSRRPIGTSC